VRDIKRVPLSQIVVASLRDAFTLIRTRCEVRMSGDQVVETSEYDIRRALTEVFINSAQALAKAKGSSPTMGIDIRKSGGPTSTVTLSVTDNAFIPGRLRTVRQALDDETKTICKYVRQRCKRQLGVEVTAQGTDRELSVVFVMPRTYRAR
jgi:hypothetical protein